MVDWVGLLRGPPRSALCAKDIVAQGTDDIEERITGFESRGEKNEHVGLTERDLPLNETFPNNDANPS